ncbi:DUF4177 domain-containing protein [Cohnella sp. AR92]|uniref:DUF4177 domain-containing protein n=1 Tax=Cohnella sp. AR92 TaxID=648716 RepID=UPI000F8E8815|nr:DUF4177 domain-containing protein [Cohnella sp. AR92]RUS45438.1 DUF4177 domain-containing protein [Cohnella sp. AR92]
MYEYFFVESKFGAFFSPDAHQEIIVKYAKQGWRLVQVLPTNYNEQGKPGKCEIIFERPIPENRT